MRGTKLAGLPAGTINHHWTKSLIASPDGRKLYVGVGSNSNAGENGLAAEEGRAAVWEIDVATGAHRVFASGLRNPVGLAWEPDSRALWVSVNERDELGDHLPPDYMTSLRSALIRHRWACAGPAAQGCRSHSNTACSSGNTVRGTDRFATATKSCSCRSRARGRPAGVAIDRQGALLVADDVGNTVWRVSWAEAAAP